MSGAQPKLRTYGDPPFSVALIHGGPGVPGTMAPVAKELSSDWGVLEPLQTAKSVEGQIQELHDTIARHGAVPLTLIGSSWGGMLGFMFTARFPALVRKLILVGSGVFEESYASGIMSTRLNRLTEDERREAERLISDLQSEETKNKDDVFGQLGKLMTKTDCFDPLTLAIEAEATATS